VRDESLVEGNMQHILNFQKGKGVVEGIWERDTCSKKQCTKVLGAACL